MTREPIYAAVFAFFSGLTQGGTPLFKTATRKVTDWSVDAVLQPALYQEQVREIARYRKGFPTIWECSIRLWLYVHTNALTDSSVTPSELINPLLDAIEASLAIDDPSNNACTLGGLVSHCAIEGPVEIYEGDLGDQAVVIVPISFLTSP